jgi:outer membrane protein OmpA-like peptidoglycan-associated protein
MRGLHSHYNKHQVDEENPYWISFADIMAGLLVIFVLAAVALMIELSLKSEEWDQAIKDLAKAEQVRKDLLSEIKIELNAMDIPVTISDNDTVLRIPEDVLTFRQGRSNIPADAESQRVTLEIGKILYTHIVKDNRTEYLDTIFIEGHTDRIPYPNQAMKGNWGLSTFRAISVWNFWNQSMEANQSLVSLKNNLGKNLFSVSGYAETRPVPCSNASTEVNDPNICPSGILNEDDSLRKNRRIDIRFTVKTPKLVDLQMIRQGLD